MKLGITALVLSLAFAGLVALYAVLRDAPEAAISPTGVKAAASEPLVRSDPGIEPWKEENIPPPRLDDEPDPEPALKPTVSPAPEPYDVPEQERRPKPAPEPEGDTVRAPTEEKEPESLPVAEDEWPMPTEEEIEATRQPRRYFLPPGAVLGLTIPSIGLYDVPVLRSNTQSALDNGVIHARGTSMPWSSTPERNVYLAGHRLGWPGTGSHLVFYRLDELGLDDEILLKGRDGARYRYRVTASFAVWPDEVWVTGRIPGRDMLTLQTCTPIPGFQKRLIVRAERV